MQSQGGVCLATYLSDIRGGATGYLTVAPVVQPGAATSSARVPESRPIPRATVNPGGLILGEHYSGFVSLEILTNACANEKICYLIVSRCGTPSFGGLCEFERVESDGIESGHCGHGSS
ncbi:hypothetical protein COMA2_160027 [Candidatus Nitrospira nitrificans]|uniref:Uncharacterized protein n=1 Tax=Candidatus Nitrospira nitrificans TaxID=1742973 RepID=A0A0S4L922_9BACT|nr:hypothetical protein COMA2_160027 [Candidatus Nitrospira nitrificans]